MVDEKGVTKGSQAVNSISPGAMAQLHSSSVSVTADHHYHANENTVPVLPTGIIKIQQHYNVSSCEDSRQDGKVTPHSEVTQSLSFAELCAMYDIVISWDTETNSGQLL